MLLEMCIVLASIVRTERNASFFYGYVTTPRSINDCGKCGVWLFVNKVPFMLQEHVKTRKTDKTRLLSDEKNELGTQQTIVT